MVPGPTLTDMQPHGAQMYLRFAAMILTAMVVMYAVMYMGTYEWRHVQREPDVHGPAPWEGPWGW